MAIMRIPLGEVTGIFAHVERADKDRTRSFQTADQFGIARGGRTLAVDLRSGDRYDAFDIEEILYRKRDTRQRAEGLPPGGGVVDGIGLGERPFPGHMGKGIYRGIAFAYPGQRGLDHTARRDLSRRNGLSDLGGARPCARRLRHDERSGG